MEFLVEFDLHVPEATQVSEVLEGLLDALPLSCWMQISVTPLEAHPSDPISTGTSIEHRHPLSDPLTSGELRVLRFLPSNLSAADIGSQLYLSLNTIRTHLRHIYAKFDVHTRTAAVERARELGLLVPAALRH